MIGDFATKPLQGAVFEKFRDCVMGVLPIETSAPIESKSIVDKTRRPKKQANVW
jgi:hypothetical protein